MSTGFWTLDRVARALSLRVTVPAPRGSRALGHVSTDSRTIRAGDIFVALAGERFDAHDFLSDAIAAGAHALVVSRPVALGELNVPVYLVDDTLVALGDLARFQRLAWGGTVIAVAGSNGKTSTKELLRSALESRLSVHATSGNLNNRIGVPLTLLSLPADADIAVIELGTSVPGEIATLRDIARPDIAIVASIAEEHLEGFGDIAGVLREESSVFHGVALGIVPAHDAVLAATAASCARVVSAGLDDGDVHASSWKLENDGTGTVVVNGTSIHSPLRGAHNLRNLMLAIAAAAEAGVDAADAARGIAKLVPPPMRASWQRIGNALVINDAYNSNPGSALAAIEMLTTAPGVQKVAVLGSMLELGANSDRCHDAVARAALASPVSIIGGVGEFVAALRRVGADDDRVVVAQDIEQLWALLERRVQPDATILLKASRGAKLERIIPHITSWANRDC
ncbi:MAG TPA: UDP-N-acetylmuramoyl-tripeptide--D-alanyl-D-alanine ligase [Gemmatimonadaceae bacterium]